MQKNTCPTFRESIIPQISLGKISFVEVFKTSSMILLSVLNLLYCQIFIQNNSFSLLAYDVFNGLNQEEFLTHSLPFCCIYISESHITVGLIKYCLK